MGYSRSITLQIIVFSFLQVLKLELFIRNSLGAFLVFDLSKKISFLNLVKWISEI
jgi:hypothetical protein